MRKVIVLLFLLGGLVSTHAQVTFVIEELPENTPPADIIYVAGDFQGWSPGSAEYALQFNEDGKWSITLDAVAEGITYHIKFTRGNWETVEKDPNGEEIPDRKFTFGNGKTVNVIIENWADISGPSESTAAWNVSVMDENFYMPQLDRRRRIWLYLPPGYDSSDLNYPVLYMHDGQNLFDKQTSYLGEWGVDETLNNLAAQGYQVPIVVGIDNGEEYRIDELTPWVNNEYGGGHGGRYMAFIVETLKPYIDKHYRSLPDRDNTGIMGSSLGGLISTYGALKYQEFFSKVGSFSPAYWINNDSIWDFVSAMGKKHNIRIYQSVGETEGDQYIQMMYQMDDSLKSSGFEHLVSNVLAGGGHNEATWRDDFERAYLYLCVSYANAIDNDRDVRPLMISPNPVNSSLVIRNPEIKSPTSLSIVDLSGREFFQKNDSVELEIDISEYPDGIYIINILTEDDHYVGRFKKQQ